MFLLLLLVGPGLTDDCQDTRTVYPKVTAPGLTDVSELKNIICDMFSESCCTFVTEYKMQQAAEKWGGSITGTFDSAVQILSERKLFPDKIPSSVLSSVSASVDYSVPLNKGSLTKLSLIASGVTCSENSSEYEIMKEYMQPAVDDMADTITALTRGIKVLKETYSLIQSYKIRDECKKALIQNGVSTLESLQNNNCQVCRSETISYPTCKNTCQMVVSGCFNQLAALNELLPLLLYNLDGIYTTLELQLRDKYLTSLDFMATTYPHCFVDQDFVNQVEEGNVDRFYFTDTLKLTEVTLDNRMKLACSSSVSNTECWTSSGVTDTDPTSEIGFTRSEQERNLILPLREEQIPEEVRETERKLGNTISEISLYATSRQPDTDTPGTSRGSTSTSFTPTPIQTEPGDVSGEEGSVKDNSANRGSDLSGLVGGLVLVLLNFWYI
ncbi:hypothetical protein ACHWQZ_G016535 [Mnemiopsis leidyi]